MKRQSDLKKSASNIIVFNEFKKKEDKLVTSTLAAILAIKIEHPKDISPDQFLINQIESYENLEILAFEDALENDNIGLTNQDIQNDASNDNYI
jgi:hypothetical protein